ncbi:MAG TPA: 1,4-alpha-glucan branching protein GlgB [Acidimicrobiia bacterium]
MSRRVSADDRWLLSEGRHQSLYEILGCHLDRKGATFRVWAPNAAWVSVIGSFNEWKAEANPMTAIGAGLWEARVEGVRAGATYKFRVTAKPRSIATDKADPYAFRTEKPPATGSRAWSLDYDWGDGNWMEARTGLEPGRPVSIYEMHLGSWRDHNRVTYRGLADQLIEYLHWMGFTHVEFLPVMEHPFYGSWGYQGTAYFAPTARYGTPQDLMYLIDRLHQAGLGVILDWVPSHFPTDQHGLAYFDGTHLYEHADPRRGYHPDWTSYIFNYDRAPVHSFLLSSAHFWLDRYHVDGLRVDAVASMLYLDYSRREGEWLPNQHGGRENLGAVEFLKKLNSTIRHRFPGTAVIAEESTSWPRVTAPPEHDGLGFHYKWDMGWMNDTLRYVHLDPLFRSHPETHRFLTFRGLYAGSERFVLPFSHDEVVHGKRSLLNKQWGDEQQRYAGLRAMFGYMWATPGKKLLFMGGEIAATREWNHDANLDWRLLDQPQHSQVQEWVRTLNKLLAAEPALHEGDHTHDGFRWIEPDDYARAAIAFLRQADSARPILFLANFTPVTWNGYRVGVPTGGKWKVLASSDDPRYGGFGTGPVGSVEATAGAQQGFDHHLTLTLPPLSALFIANDDLEED